MPERLDGADFVVSAESAVFGSDHPWVAAQYAGCGESNSAHGGVNLPAALLAGSMNVSRESGELESNQQILNQKPSVMRHFMFLLGMLQQGISKRPFPGCESAAGKLRQKR